MHQNKGLFTFLLVCAMFAWGFSWSSGKSIASTGDKNVLLFWRFLITWISFIPLTYKKDLSLNFRGFLFVMAGSFFYAIYNIFFFFGLEKGLAGAGGVLVTTLNPLLTFIVLSLIERKLLQKKEAIGLLLGITGGAFMIGIWNFSFEQLIHSGNAYFLLASLTWSFVTILTQRSGVSSTSYTFYVYLISTVMVFLYNPLAPYLSAFEFEPSFWFHIFYLSVVSTTFGTTIFLLASQKLGPGKASSFIFLVPASALTGSFLFLGEIPEGATIAGGILAAIAVIIINKEKNTRNKASA